MSSTALLLAASFVVGQETSVIADEPEHNPHLLPMAWMIGEWESKQMSAVGELRTTYRNTIKWTAKNKVIKIELSETRADGTSGSVAVILIHWDGSMKKIREYGVWSDGSFVEGTIAELDETGHLWEQRMVYRDGNQGSYKHKVTHDPIADEL